LPDAVHAGVAAPGRGVGLLFSRPIM
jgi:hypothetical protein